MYLVAYPVSRTGKLYAVACGNGLEEPVIIGIPKVGLQQVMVYITYGQFRLDFGYAYGLKFQVCHGARGVLSKCLVNADSDLTAWIHFTFHQVRRYNFFCCR
jgi:hypothetical protein